MIYPLTTGKGEEHFKLRTLESVWIRGRLKMWGRWAAFSKVPDAAGMFNQLLEEPTITKKALQRRNEENAHIGFIQRNVINVLGRVQG